MKYYSYEEFLQDLKDLHNKIDCSIGKPDAIIAIARGGLTMAHLLALRWDLREVYTLNAISYQGEKQGELIIKNIPTIAEGVKKVLIVDEIVDSGKSLIKVVEILKKLNVDVDFYTSAIFQKESAVFRADFSLREPESWIDFFWEKDMFE